VARIVFEMQGIRKTFLLTAFIVAGCATSYYSGEGLSGVTAYPQSIRDPERIHRNDVFLDSEGLFGRTVKLEGRISAQEWAAIDNHQVFVGMSELAATYALGAPTASTAADIILESLIWSSSSSGAAGYVTQRKGDWGIRRIYVYECDVPKGQTGCAPKETWEELGVLDSERKFWIFVENGIVVNYNHGSFEDIYNYDHPKEDRWRGWGHVLFDFSRLPEPPDGVFYAVPQNADPEMSKLEE
jgi:hypothetical protein